MYIACSSEHIVFATFSATVEVAVDSSKENETPSPTFYIPSQSITQTKRKVVCRYVRAIPQ
jgi:hypothetical protein